MASSQAWLWSLALAPVLLLSACGGGSSSAPAGLNGLGEPAPGSSTSGPGGSLSDGGATQASPVAGAGIYRTWTQQDIPQTDGCLVAPDGHAKCFIRPASGSSTVTVYSVANLPLPTQAAAGAPIKFKDINYTKYVVDEAEVEVAPATSTAPATFDRPLIADLPLEKGAASGTLTIGKSLDISFAPTTNNNPAFHMLVDGGAIPFDAPDTSRAASFQMLAGSYQWHYVDSSDTQSSGDLTIDNTGAVTGNEYITNVAQPCTFSGKMSVPDGKVNVYPGTITRDCPSETPPEMTLDVLASIFNDGSAPSRLLVVATGGDRKIGLPGGGSK